MNVIPQGAKDGFVRLIGPVARGLIRAGVHPNTITTVGTLIFVASGVAFGLGWVHRAGFLLLLSGLFDILDGHLRRSHRPGSPPPPAVPGGRQPPPSRPALPMPHRPLP